MACGGSSFQIRRSNKRVIDTGIRLRSKEVPLGRLMDAKRPLNPVRGWR